MATKLRLQRHGKKGKPFYHLVAADSRAKRDGKFIEKIGTYNPNVNPASIDIDFERALHWVKVGAVPTDTVRAILSYEGVMLKNHLDKGVSKGAHSQADADKKFEAWKKEKQAKIDAKVKGLSDAEAKAIADQLAKEKEQNAERAAAIAAANAPEEEVVEEAAPEAAAEEAAPEAATEEAPAAEETAAEEAPAEEEKKDEE